MRLIACGLDLIYKLAAQRELAALRPMMILRSGGCGCGVNRWSPRGEGGLLPRPSVVTIADVFNARVPACAAIFAFVVLPVCDALAPEWLVSVDRAGVLVVFDRRLINVR